MKAYQPIFLSAMLKNCLLIGFLSTAHLLSVGQEFGGNPPSVKWQQVNNQAARVIYPRGLDSIAWQVGATVGILNSTTQRSIGTRQRKVNIVLQNQTTVSNAYVTLAPFRSEFNLTPPQNSLEMGSLPWQLQLSNHEFRHVQQNNNLNVGLSRVFWLVFGEGGQAVANALAVPDWFYEGDAVYNETNQSLQGRGRLPAFFDDYRSLWEAQKNYSWMKLRNGSLRDYVPDHYRLGYMMVAYGREKYGDEVWKKITHDAAAFTALVYPFQHAVKRYTGKSYVDFRREAFTYFRESLVPDNADRIQRRQRKHFVADEENPAYINDSTLLYMRSSYRAIPAFTIRTNGRERALRVRDVSLDSYFSYRNGRIVYAAFQPDARWGWRDYSDLRFIDVNTGQQRSVTRHTKYFSPDISDDGKTIVAVRVDPDGKHRLELLDAMTGSVTKTFPNKDHLFYTYPVFHQSGVISCVRNSEGRMALALLNDGNGQTRLLTPFSNNVIGFPSVQGDTIYFTASHAGRDRLFGYDVKQQQLFLLIHSSLESVTGDYRLVAGHDTLAWSHFTASGYLIMEVDKSAVTWQPLEPAQFTLDLPDFGIAALGTKPVGLPLSTLVSTGSSYSKAFQLFNFHSIYPLVNDPDYSLALIGQNVLNTLQSEAFFLYNRNEKFKQVGVTAVYGAWFPNVSFGGSYAFDRRGLFHGRRIYWNESDIHAGANLPLNLSRGRNYTSLDFGSDIAYKQPVFRGVYKDSLGDQSFGYLNNYLLFTNQVQQARQQIYPRFAQTVSLNFRKSVTRVDASQWLLSGSIYLPGIARNHSLVLQAAYQQRDTLNQHRFSNSFPFSRGYNNESLYRMVKWGMNYHLPLFYPDAGFGNIVYLLRVRVNGFYDQTLVTDNRLKQAFFRSAGTEFFFDTKWWNQLRLSIGVRYSHLLDRDLFGGSGRNRFELVLPVNLLQR